MIRFGSPTNGTGLGLHTFNDMTSENQDQHTPPRQTCAPGVTMPAERTAIRPGWNEGAERPHHLGTMANKPEAQEAILAPGCQNKVNDSEQLPNVTEGDKQFPYLAEHVARRPDGTQREPPTTAMMGDIAPAKGYPDLVGQRADAAEAGLTSSIVSTILSIPAMVSSVVAAFFTNMGGYAQVVRAVQGTQQK